MKNKKIIDYIILERESKEALRVEVLQKIKEGYRPLGGISLAVDPSKVNLYSNYAQSMVKYADE